MSQSRRTRKTRATALLGVGTLLVGGGVAALAPAPRRRRATARHPAIAGQPEYDNTDLYAFVSPDTAGTVTLIANWIPFEEPGGGPNFYPWATDARYDINIDNDGDAKADVIYRWKFSNTRTPKPSDCFTGNGTFLYNNGPVTSLNDANLLFRQTVRPHPHRGAQGPGQGPHGRSNNAPVAPSYVGDAVDAGLRARCATRPSRPTTAAASRSPVRPRTRSSSTCGSSTCSTAATALTEAGHDTLAGYNVNSVALQVPRRRPDREGQAVVGIWSTTDAQERERARTSRSPGSASRWSTRSSSPTR